MSRKLTIAVIALVLVVALSGAVAWACRGDSPRYSRDSDDKQSARLLLTLVITDSAAIIGAIGGVLPSLWYREFHRYVTRDGFDTLIEYRPGGGAHVNPKRGKAFEPHEKTGIHLYVTDDEGGVRNALYTKDGELLVDPNDDGYDGDALSRVNAGDTVFALRKQRRQIIVTDPAEFESRPLSVYDVLLRRLIRVKERYGETVVDADEIVIAAEDDVIYDKIVRLMDVARLAGFPVISVAKRRG